MNPNVLLSAESALNSAEQILASEFPVPAEVRRIQEDLHALLQRTTSARIRAEHAAESSEKENRPMAGNKGGVG